MARTYRAPAAGPQATNSAISAATASGVPSSLPRPGPGGPSSCFEGSAGHGLGRPGGLISDFFTASLESPHRFRTLAYEPSWITWSRAAA